MAVSNIQYRVSHSVRLNSCRRYIKHVLFSENEHCMSFKNTSRVSVIFLASALGREVDLSSIICFFIVRLIAHNLDARILVVARSFLFRPNILDSAFHSISTCL